MQLRTVIRSQNWLLSLQPGYFKPPSFCFPPTFANLIFFLAMKAVAVNYIFSRRKRCSMSHTCQAACGLIPQQANFCGTAKNTPKLVHAFHVFCWVCCEPLAPSKLLLNFFDLHGFFFSAQAPVWQVKQRARQTRQVTQRARNILDSVALSVISILPQGPTYSPLKSALKKWGLIETASQVIKIWAFWSNLTAILSERIRVWNAKKHKNREN